MASLLSPAPNRKLIKLRWKVEALKESKRKNHRNFRKTLEDIKKQFGTEVGQVVQAFIRWDDAVVEKPFSERPKKSAYRPWEEKLYQAMLCDIN